MQLPEPGASLAGRYFFARDTQELYLCDGTTWAAVPLSVVFGPSGAGHGLGIVPDPGAIAGSSKYLREDATWNVPSGGSGGGLTLIQEIALGSPGASIDFTGIPQTFRHLRLVCTLRSAAATDYDAYEMRFNGDATSGHYGAAEGYNAGHNDQFESTAAFLGYGPAASTPAGQAFAGEAVIHHYRETVFYKGFTVFASMNYAGYHAPMYTAGEWFATDAITALSIFVDGGNLDTGSMASLYGMA